MSIFYRYAGNAPAKYLERGAESPQTVARALKADLSHHIKERQMPSLRLPQARESFLTLGMSARADWLSKGVSGKARRKRIVILHWPSIVENCLRIQLLSPAVPLLVWLLRDALARRSLFLVDLLQRKFPWEYQKFTNADPVGMPEPLSPVEDSLLAFYLRLAAKDQAVVSALKLSYDKTFEILTTKKSCIDIARDFTLNRHAISTYYFDRVPEMLNTLPKETLYRGLAEPTFGPTRHTTPLRELMVAWHARLPHDHMHYDDALKEIGVLYDAENKMLLINMRRFFLYRRKCSPILEEMLPKEMRGTGEALEVQARTIVRLLEERYSSLIPAEGVGAYRNVYYGNGTAWNYEEWDQTLFVDIDAYRKLVDRTRASELARLGLKVPKRVWREQTSHMVKTRKPAGFVECYENPRDSEKLKFYLVALGRRIYFNPPWEVPEQERYRDVRSYKSSGPTQRIREEVKYSKALDMWLYSFDFLMRQKGAPVGTAPGLRDWLHSWHTMDLKDFRRLAKRKVEVHRKAEFRTNRKELRGVRFNAEEDEAILNYYRPVMEFDGERAIFEACGGRTAHAISNRARVLCDELLASGVYDLNRLPHRRYNHNLLKRMKRAAELNGDDPEKAMEDAAKVRQDGYRLYRGPGERSEEAGGEPDAAREDTPPEEVQEGRGVPSGGSVEGRGVDGADGGVSDGAVEE